MSFTPEKIAEIQSTLSQFTGTEQYHKFNFGSKLTDGVKYLFDSCESYWLGDVILSYQGSPLITKNTMLKEFQIWELKVNLEERSCVVTCKADTGYRPAITQSIEFTTFPLEEIKLYYIDKVILLPSEY